MADIYKKYPKVSDNPEKAFEAAYKSAINILYYKDNSEAMLRKKLFERGHTEETVDRVFATLKKNGFFNEGRNLQNEVRRLTLTRKFGKSRLLFELKRLGYTSEDIANIDIEEIDFDEICYELLLKKGGKKDIKTKNALLSKGHNGDSIRRAYLRYAEEHPEIEDDDNEES